MGQATEVFSIGRPEAFGQTGQQVFLSVGARTQESACPQFICLLLRQTKGQA